MSNKDYFGENVMSNDNAIVRCFKLWAKISMMIVDGRRDGVAVADMLQGILDQSLAKPTFDPATFIGAGWSYAEPRDQKSSTLALLGDYSKVKLSTDWLEGELGVYGEIRHSRILKDSSSVPLNCDHFFDLWNNKEKIPEEWKKVSGYITFNGDTLRNPKPNAFRVVLSLCWRDDTWTWVGHVLDSKWFERSPAAVFPV